MPIPTCQSSCFPAIRSRPGSPRRSTPESPNSSPSRFPSTRFTTPSSRSLPTRSLSVGTASCSAPARQEDRWATRAPSPPELRETGKVAQRPNSNTAVADDAAHEMTAQLQRLAAIAATVAGDDPVACAEAALAKLSSEFGAWMYEECERLEAARQDAVRQGLTQKTHG